MVKVVIGCLSTLGIIYIVPFIVYALLSLLIGAKTPEGASPLQFLTSVLVSKIGTAIAITSLFYLSKDIFSEKWLIFSLIWWIMFVLGELGQMIIPGYTWKEALGGIISETIYIPLSVFVLRTIFK